jgi:hypothetical protein
MERPRVLRNSGGFYVVSALMGAIFIITVMGIGYYIGSEDAQMLKAASSGYGEGELDFIAQAIQVDYYDNYLQSSLEKTVVDYMESKVHIIDPGATFMQNMGDGIQNALKDRLSSLFQGGAGVYADAYSRLERIECEPLEVGGAEGYARLQESGDSILVTARSLGQRIKCDSTEPEATRTIDLLGRDYELTTRAKKMHDVAIEGINSIDTKLDSGKGVWKQNVWHLAEDISAKQGVFSMWNSFILSLNSLPLEDSGIYVQPGSISVKSGSGGPYTVEDIVNFGCDGETGPGRMRTCRPDDITLTIGEPCDSDDRSLTLSLKYEDPSVKVTALGMSIDLGPIGKAIGKLLGDAINQVSNEGCLEYASATKICRGFAGKPSDGIVSGTVAESNQNFMPAGRTEPILMRFESETINIDDSNVQDDLDCGSDEGEELALNTGVAIITKDGRDNFELKLVSQQVDGEQQWEVTEDSQKKLVDKVNNDPRFRDVQQTVNLYATLPGGTPIQLKGSPTATGTVSPTSKQNIDIASGTPTAGQVLSGIGTSMQTADPTQVYGGIMNIFDDAASAASSLGDSKAADSLGKAATVACKMMGLRNYMELGDKEKAVLAICGIALVTEIEGGETICKLAGFVSVFDTGNAEAIARAIEQLLEEAGFPNIRVDIEAIKGAVERGDLMGALRAVAERLRLDGLAQAANFMENLASMIYNLDKLDTKALLAATEAALKAIGEEELGDLLGGLSGLEDAIKRGDIGAVASSIGKMAENLGFEGLGEIGSVISNVGGLYNAVVDFDKFKEMCEDSIPWDMICIEPNIAGGVCPEMHGDCAFESGLPTFDINLLCNDLVFKGGFQLDCTCMYACPGPPPFTLPVPQSVGINIDQLLASLNLEGLEDILKLIDLGRALASGDVMEFCRFDP